MTNPSYQLIDVGLIDPGTNVRRAECPEADAELTESIRTIGVQQPICVVANGKRFTLLFGARRLRCSIAAGKVTIPAIVLAADIGGGERDAVQIAENVQRADLNAGDLCEAVARLIDVAGWPATRVAKHLGKSEPTISRLHTIGKGPTEVLERLRSGKVTMSAAYSLCRMGEGGERDGLLNRSTNGTISREALNAAIKANGSPRPKRAGSWKMFRTVGPGVGVTVFGSDTSYDQLLGVLARFIERQSGEVVQCSAHAVLVGFPAR